MEVTINPKNKQISWLDGSPADVDDPASCVEHLLDVNRLEDQTVHVLGRPVRFHCTAPCLSCKRRLLSAYQEGWPYHAGQHGAIWASVDPGHAGAEAACCAQCLADERARDDIARQLILLSRVLHRREKGCA